MKIALIGYGKMGKMIEQIAREKQHSIVAIVDSRSRSSSFRTQIMDQIRQADVCIDFTHPHSVVETVKMVAESGKPLVIGTTGWENDFHEVKEIVQKHQMGCVYAPNFSLGVNLFARIVKEASSLIGLFDDYDVAGREYHHHQKADSPSGTAKLLADIVMKNIAKKKRVVHELGNRKIEKDELHFPSMRCGHTPGTHEIVFDSSADTVILSHVARNREGFAKGAIAAAEWLVGKKGFYTMDDMIDEMMNNSQFH